MSTVASVPANIRPGQADDIPAIAEIERASFGDPWSEVSFRELLDMRDAIFLVATSQPAGAVTGYVIVRLVAGEADVLNLAVNPSERRRGRGGELLDAGLAVAVHRGAREIFLEVRESNDSAMSLYRSRGFTAVSRRSRYYRNPVEDALLLRHAIEG